MVAAVVNWVVAVAARHLREPRDVGAAVDHPLLHLEDDRRLLLTRRVFERDLLVLGARHERDLQGR